MFNKSAIFYISKNNISAVSSSTLIKELDIAPTLISSDEVLEPDAYNSLSKFIADSKLTNHTVIIIIDESLVFEKTQTQEIEQADINQFAKDLPFDLQKLAFTNVKVENNHILLATNKQIYLGLAAALAQNKSKVEYVIPAKYFTIIKNDLQSSDFSNLRSKITKNPYLAQTKFLCTEVEVSQFTQPVSNTPNNPEPTKTDDSKTVIQEPTNQDHKKTNPLLFVVFFVLLLVLVALVIWKFYLNK